MRGPMARRLTTNQEIPGSIPGVFIYFAQMNQGTERYLFCVAVPQINFPHFCFFFHYVTLFFSLVWR
jgi:hypothetical protein